MSEPDKITLNGATFSRYECQVCCAIKLWIKTANKAAPSDDSLGYIVNSLRGKVNGTAMPCKNILDQIKRHSEEGVRSIHLSVACNESHWAREASRVYYAWLKQNSEIVKRFASARRLQVMEWNAETDTCFRLNATGALAPFLNPDGTLKTSSG